MSAENKRDCRSFERVAVPEPKRGAGEISKAVNRQARRLFKSGNEKRGCKMGEMMFDMMNGRFQFHAVFLLERGLDRGGTASSLSFGRSISDAVDASERNAGAANCSR